ncbi:helix-turn-helix domain-containing protein [Chondromyces crocatus]|uniref:Transposase n=1 Tax=Chondromyces crocatus TaxID=52 RepID=A0A0K1ELU5_CHOCO|nr:hypothetical protein [Chondromyces crocatus]AKT41627.1 uncharacterized protein CMC5_058340 [Chondromyces crocatus]
MGPYPIELRQRILDAYDRGEGSVRELASLFDVAPNTVQSYITRRKRTGNVSPTPQTKRGPDPSIGEDGLKLLRMLVSAQNDRTIDEYIALYEAETHSHVSRSVMVRALKRAGLVRKKRHYVPANKTGLRFNERGKRFGAARVGMAPPN